MSVSRRILDEVELPSESVKDALSQMCPEVHLGATEKGDQFFQELRRTVYTTPKSFLDLLNLFVSALGEKREELASNHKRLSSGITKLKETNVIVQELQETLKKLQPELEIKTE